MNIFLAGNIGKTVPQEYITLKAPFVLQTFWDIKDSDESVVKAAVNTPKMFFLDSGAFTFMNSGVKVDWEEYADRYADFICRYGVKYYFNIDLDTIMGVEYTDKLTERLEQKTKRQSIRVWHRCMGLDKWREICQNYEYVAIGASALTEECRWVQNPDLLRKMIKIAHGYGAKVHGLGYTRLSNINNTTVPFDSVDSSSALSGGRFATVYKFTGTRIISTHIKGRSKGYKELNRHNIQEWIKISKYKAGILDEN